MRLRFETGYTHSKSVYLNMKSAILAKHVQGGSVMGVMDLHGEIGLVQKRANEVWHRAHRVETWEDEYGDMQYDTVPARIEYTSSKEDVVMGVDIIAMVHAINNSRPKCKIRW